LIYIATDCITLWKNIIPWLKDFKGKKMFMKENREITIYDIARALNISPSTVSRGLNGQNHINKETVRKILATAAEMGYQRNKFASDLRKRKTHTLGVVVHKLNSYFLATAIAGIERVTNSNGYTLIISQSQESWKKEKEGVKTLFNSRVDGLIVSLASDTRNLDHFNIFFDKSIPVVFFDRVLECKGCASIVIDNFKAAYESVSHLVSQGCRRIFHLGGNLLMNVYSERLRGYRKALEDNGISYDKDLVMISSMYDEAADQAVKKILSFRNRPDGVFTANDATAISIMASLKKHGIRIPTDIAVAGFNNEPISRVIEPNLTTVEYPAREIGEIAASTIINRLNNPNQAGLRSVVVEHKLIIRDSTLRIR
jgi:LacI family transcriptional regulator